MTDKKIPHRLYLTEEQMPRNVDKPCTAQDPCTDNSPVQTDDETYEIVQE